MSLVVARSSEERAIHIDEYERDRDGTVHCGSCGGKVIAKRGERKVHHYAHACGESCDPWRTSDEMGPWHKRWQGYASKEHLEVTIVKEGVRHIADIRVPETGLVIEVQHSPMPIEEARAREAFYENMIWIVDATESKECGREAVRLVGRNWGLIVVPRVFWSSLSKPTYIDTRWGLFEPAFWEGRHCIARPVGVREVLRESVRVGAGSECGGDELGVLFGQAGRGGSENESEDGCVDTGAVWGVVRIQRGAEKGGIYLAATKLAVHDACGEESGWGEGCGASSAGEGEAGAGSGVQRGAASA